MPVIPAVSYLSTGLAGYLVGPGISRGVRKLARTPRVIKKKNDGNIISTCLFLCFKNLNFYFKLIFFW